MDELSALLTSERLELIERSLRLTPLDSVEDLLRRIHQLGLTLTGPEGVPPEALGKWADEARDGRR